jgi:hypothetical protein
MATHEEILGKIRSLHRLASDASARGSVHEAEAAAARADKMIQRYRLDAATFDGGAPEVDAIGEECLEDCGQRRTPWKGSLAATLARHYGCKSYTNCGIKVTIRVVGHASDVAIVRGMFAWLTLEITRLAVQYAPGTRGSPWGSAGETRAKRNAFCLGAVRGFGVALADSKRRAEYEHRRQHAEPGRAAMVLRERDVAVQAYVAEHVGKLRNLGASYSHASAYMSGRSAGARLNVNRAPALVGAHRALPGKR